MLLLREPGSGSRAVAEEFFATHCAQPRQTITISGCEAVKQTVIADLGVALIGLHALALELHGGDLVLLDVRHTPIERRWRLVRFVDKKLSPASQALWGVLASEAPAWLEQRFAEALAGLSAGRSV